MQTIRLGAFLAAFTLLATMLAQANPIDDCNQSADIERQIDGCTQFLQLDPFSPHVALAYGRRGEAYVHKGDFARAIADFDQAIALDPKDADAYYNRGWAYDEKGELDRAIADYTKAIALDPNDADHYYGRGWAYQNKGDKDKAIADYRKALEIDPSHQYAKNNLKRLGMTP